MQQQVPPARGGFDRIALALGACAFAVHAAFGARYDTFRDELYFIVCGRHPAFGYADQPPLIPLLSAALYGLGAHTWLLRLPCMLAAAALVWLAVRFVRFLGGGDGAAIAAGVACLAAPMFLGIFATFNTTVFEPLAWTAIAYALARAAAANDRRALVWSGAVAGLALEAKYALVMWLVALLGGIAAAGPREILRRRETVYGVGIALAIALPSVVWQAAHGWPFVELVSAAGNKNAAVGPVAFLVNQILVMNPLFAPLWVLGVAAPFVLRRLAPLRFLPVAFSVVVVLTILSHGKDYYVAAAYPSLFVLGSVALEHYVRANAARAAYLAAGAALSAFAAPLSLPVLAPPALAAYEQRFHLVPQQQERSFAGTVLPQEFADELGWHDFVREVDDAWQKLAPEARERTAVKVDNYGEAAALDVYGARYGLPPALSGHNQYYLWGLRGQHPRDALVVQRHVEELRPFCSSVRVLGTTFSPYAMAYENGKVIAVCRDVKPSLETLWPQLKNFS